ncbi:hypothetical protein ACFVZC_07265 [Streptomyces marokkonensis]|uniref:Uncharacterized protein n=1 Tax=Streptomyces marokkonensis TaxID=324855 RepID=A0ABW6Q1Z7_9ACTN
MSADTGWNAAQLLQIEVHGGNPEELPVQGTDPARGEPVEASSTIHSFVAANANGGPRHLRGVPRPSRRPHRRAGRRRRPQRCRRRPGPGSAWGNFVLGIDDDTRIPDIAVTASCRRPTTTRCP